MSESKLPSTRCDIESLATGLVRGSSCDSTTKAPSFSFSAALVLLKDEEVGDVKTGVCVRSLRPSGEDVCSFGASSGAAAGVTDERREADAGRGERVDLLLRSNGDARGEASLDGAIGGVSPNYSIR